MVRPPIGSAAKLKTHPRQSRLVILRQGVACRCQSPPALCRHRVKWCWGAQFDTPICWGFGRSNCYNSQSEPASTSAPARKHLDLDAAAGRGDHQLRETNRHGVNTRRHVGPVGHHLELSDWKAPRSERRHCSDQSQWRSSSAVIPHRAIEGDAPNFVEVGEAGIAVDDAMRRQLAVQSSS
jgi:hypothetical protein